MPSLCAYFSLIHTIRAWRLTAIVPSHWAFRWSNSKGIATARKRSGDAPITRPLSSRSRESIAIVTPLAGVADAGDYRAARRAPAIGGSQRFSSGAAGAGAVPSPEATRPPTNGPPAHVPRPARSHRAASRAQPAARAQPSRVASQRAGGPDRLGHDLRR